jgi:hypothetical protein
MTLHDSASTAPEDPPSLTIPFWRTVAEGWCQDQLAQVNSIWSLCHASYLQPTAPPIPPSLHLGASMVEVSMTPQTYNAASAWRPLTTATAMYSCFRLEAPQVLTATSNSSPPSPTPTLTKANTPSGGTLSMTSQKMVKKLKILPPKPRKKCHPSSGWRYMTEAEWAQRQTMEEVFRVIAAGQTHLGLHSVQCAVLYPQLCQASTTTGDITTSPSISLPPMGEVSPQPNMSASIWGLTPP